MTAGASRGVILSARAFDLYIARDISTTTTTTTTTTINNNNNNNNK